MFRRLLHCCSSLWVYEMFRSELRRIRARDPQRENFALTSKQKVQVFFLGRPCNPHTCLLLQPLRINSHPGPKKRCLFVCRHGERMDVVFGKYWLSQCFDAKGKYLLGANYNRFLPSITPCAAGRVALKKGTEIEF